MEASFALEGAPSVDPLGAFGDRMEASLTLKGIPKVASQDESSKRCDAASDTLRLPLDVWNMDKPASW
jgi:hypothetical protein